MATAMLCLTGYFNKDSQVVKAYDVNSENVEADLNNSGDIFDGYFVCLLLGTGIGSFITHKFYEVTKNKLESEINRLNKLNQSRTMVLMDPRFYGQGYYPSNDGYYGNNRSMRGTEYSKRR